MVYSFKNKTASFALMKPLTAFSFLPKKVGIFKYDLIQRKNRCRVKDWRDIVDFVSSPSPSELLVRFSLQQLTP